jgi:hypothetical protein
MIAFGRNDHHGIKGFLPAFSKKNGDEPLLLFPCPLAEFLQVGLGIGAFKEGFILGTQSSRKEQDRPRGNRKQLFLNDFKAASELSTSGTTSI